ncbi:MAG: type II toxin-antitoxin system HipA family toxin [Planctomycetota bacterium]
MTTARVRLWGRDIAAVTWDSRRELAVFQYAPEFLQSGIQVAPIMMPLAEGTFEFPSLSRDTFRGLPGLLADSLPDKFGNAIIDAWLATQGREPDSLNPVERLCYIGNRGMGALEFLPTLVGVPTAKKNLDIAALVDLASRVLRERETLAGAFSGEDDAQAIQDILRVGSSAGGARAKAVVAWNEQSGEFRSGQVDAPSEFTQWLMKFDGVQNNRDKEVADPQGYGRIEFAYYLMALEAGIEMMPSRLYEEGGRAHFMTQRFDHSRESGKRHMQSLGALMHYDFNQPGAYSYEQTFQTMSQLGLPRAQIEQQYRRTTFNVTARNQDDHVKNIAFLMDRRGTWKLSPAFDVMYAYNPTGSWTSRHQMSIQGKRDEFEMDDLLALASTAGIKKPRARKIMLEVKNALAQWSQFAIQTGVFEEHQMKIEKSLRYGLFE